MVTFATSNNILQDIKNLFKIVYFLPTQCSTVLIVDSKQEGTYSNAGSLIAQWVADTSMCCMLYSLNSVTSILLFIRHIWIRRPAMLWNWNIARLWNILTLERYIYRCHCGIDVKCRLSIKYCKMMSQVTIKISVYFYM